MISRIRRAPQGAHRRYVLQVNGKRHYDWQDVRAFHTLAVATSAKIKSTGGLYRVWDRKEKREVIDRSFVKALH